MTCCLLGKQLWVSGPPVSVLTAVPVSREAQILDDLIWLMSTIDRWGKHDFTCTQIEFFNFTLQLEYLLFKVSNQPKMSGWIIYQPHTHFLQQVVFDSLASNIMLCQIWEAFWKVYSQAKQSKLCLFSFERFFFFFFWNCHNCIIKTISSRVVFRTQITTVLPTYMYR